MSEPVIPFFVTMPHSGEKVPEECTWLHNLDEKILMCDVDRYIDVIYEPSLKKLQVPYHKTEWHRYAVDLNRIPQDIDCDSVIGSENKSGSNSRGFHWVVTTLNYPLMQSPITKDLHNKLTDLIYTPFHDGVKKLYADFKKKGFEHVFHLDAHSMPSLGTNQHKDPGQYRADIVISDNLGVSCDSRYKDLVIEAYKSVGFSISYNWPYMGGRVTQQYGQPEIGQQALQVELNRALYMDEVTKKIKPDYVVVQEQIFKALEIVKRELPNLKI